MTNETICDIIVENTRKDFSAMNIMIPQKSEVKKAGRVIATHEKDKCLYNAAIDTLNLWRFAHAEPLAELVAELHTLFPKALISQRLKRQESVVGKLERFPTMNLYKMQDLGGCRIIVDTVDEVFEVVKIIKTALSYTCRRENDYIENPKLSGYRSYHLICSHDKNPDIFLEIQVRTKLQHMWATALETASILTKTNLKSGIGDEGMLRLFALFSSLFAKSENKQTVPETPADTFVLKKEIIQLDGKYKLLQSLSHLSDAIEYHETQDRCEYGYFLLVFHYDKMLCQDYCFSTNQLPLAVETYNKIEAACGSNTNVVLVSANSFSSLREAYPNYYIDTNAFIQQANRMLCVSDG